MRHVLAFLLGLALAGAKEPSGDYLTEGDLAQVQRYMPQYEKAAKMAGVPVLALPALHYRESDLRGVRGDPRARRPVHNMGGPFMLDQGGEGNRVTFDANIRAFERAVAQQFKLEPVPRVRDDFFFSCLCAAVELRGKVRGALYRHGAVDVEVLADAMWSYNGRSQKTWRQSACVWNDPHRGRRLLIRVSIGQTVSEYLDSRPGSLVIYNELVRLNKNKILRGTMQ